MTNEDPGAKVRERRAIRVVIASLAYLALVAFAHNVLEAVLVIILSMTGLVDAACGNGCNQLEDLVGIIIWAPLLVGVGVGVFWIAAAKPISGEPTR
jgi:hypothetical protein